MIRRKFLLEPHMFARRWSILLTIAALLLWNLSLAETQFTIGFWGILGALHLSFFASLAALLIASALLWRSPRGEGVLLSLQASILITILWLTPVIIGGSLPFTDAQYGFWDQFVKPILDGGHLHPDRIWYHAFPGSWTLYASFASMAGVNALPGEVFAIYPYLVEMIFIWPLAVFLRSILPEDRRNYAWAGIWFFSLANWVGQEYLNAQGPAFLLLLTLFAIIGISLAPRKSNESAFYAFANLILVALSLTHFLTAILNFFVLLALWAFKRLARLELVLFSIAITGALLMYYGTAFFATHLNTFFSQLLRPDTLLSAGITERLSGNASHEAVARGRIALTVLLAAIALSGYLLGYTRRSANKNDRTVLALVAGTMLMVALTGATYGFETFQRSWLFLLPEAAYFSVKLLDRRLTSIIFCVILFGSVPLHIIAHYGNQSLDYLSPSYLSGTQFVREETRTNQPMGYLSGLVWRNNEMIVLDSFPAERHYLVTSDHSWAYYRFVQDTPEFVDEVQDWLGKNAYARIYTNGDYAVYQGEGRGRLR